MELKKTPKADLENKKTTFVWLGLVFALGISLLAFEWTTHATQAASLGQIDAQEVEEEIIPITRMELPPPELPPVRTIEVLNIVSDDTQIDDDLMIHDTEANENTFIEISPIIERAVEKEEESKVFQFVEDMPEFPGGAAALNKYLNNSITYPVIAQENGVQGKVFVGFVVDRDGSITNAVVTRGVDPNLDKEALRVINSMPKWKPGMQQGKTVRVSYTVPINFQLQ